MDIARVLETTVEELFEFKEEIPGVNSPGIFNKKFNTC